MLFCVTDPAPFSYLLYCEFLYYINIWSDFSLKATIIIHGMYRYTFVATYVVHKKLVNRYRSKRNVQAQSLSLTRSHRLHSPRLLPFLCPQRQLNSSIWEYNCPYTVMSVYRKARNFRGQLFFVVFADSPKFTKFKILVPTL